ncbi:inositol monophosphatase family protein [Actinoplanes sp. NPDC049265]|uniref:inositol monophosphatase family protein n=1 Tax=Actinoplanes sp. NPDC049265 TaxID=3363902 RepID=UPI00371DDF82
MARLDAEIVSPELSDAVCGVVAETARNEILPRFGALTTGDVQEKAPGDLVTTADRAAEAVLTTRLTALLPGSVVVGEEAVAGDPALLGALGGGDPVWIIDPIDGTHNFVGGDPRFAVLVALAKDGEPLASWTYEPVSGVMATAIRGGGAFSGGRRLTVRPAGGRLRGLDVVTSRPRWWDEPNRPGHDALISHGAALSYITTAGLEYAAMAAGRRDAMVCVWEDPWDHAAGLLLHHEAGGVAITADGASVDITGDNALPFVCAPDLATARRINQVIPRARP